MQLPPPYIVYNLLDWNNGKSLPWHEHPHLQFIHVLRGEMRVDYGGGWQVLKAGDLHMLPPGFKHRLHTPKHHHQLGINFQIEPDERGLLQSLLDLVKAPTVLHLPLDEAILQKLQSPPVVAPSLKSHQVGSALDQYCITILERLSAISPQELLLKKFIQYLEQHVDGPIRIQSVATTLNTSPATIQRLCQKHFSCGVAHLHERMRIQQATHLLISDTVTVTECGERFGYPDCYQFSRAFKRVTGYSPSQYRAGIQ